MSWRIIAPLLLLLFAQSLSAQDAEQSNRFNAAWNEYAGEQRKKAREQLELALDLLEAQHDSSMARPSRLTV